MIKAKGQEEISEVDRVKWQANKGNFDDLECWGFAHQRLTSSRKFLGWSSARRLVLEKKQSLSSFSSDYLPNFVVRFVWSRTSFIDLSSVLCHYISLNLYLILFKYSVCKKYIITCNIWQCYMCHCGHFLHLFKIENGVWFFVCFPIREKSSQYDF
jgi:hypothetical protein